MAKTLTATLTGQVKYVYTKTRTIADTSESKTIEQSTSYTNGGAANQVQVLYAEQLIVTAALPNQNLDLYGALTDIFGDTLNFEHIKAILVRNKSTTVGDDVYFGPLGVDNPLASPWGGDTTAKNAIRAGGAFQIDAPLDGLVSSSTKTPFSFSR